MQPDPPPAPPPCFSPPAAAAATLCLDFVSFAVDEALVHHCRSASEGAIKCTFWAPLSFPSNFFGQIPISLFISLLLFLLSACLTGCFHFAGAPAAPTPSIIPGQISRRLLPLSRWQQPKRHAARLTSTLTFTAAR